MSKKARFTEGAYAILKAMKGGKKARGFTIIETIIVLAVTSGLFVAVAATLSGRQQKTQFTQAIQEIQSEIQQVVSDVGVGYYPGRSNFSCSATLSGPTFGAGNTEQGKNAGCVFLGKAIQLKVGSTDPEVYNTYTIAGLQRDTAGNEITSYPAANAKVVAAPNTSASADATDVKKLQYGLTTAEAYYNNPGKVPISSVAFVNSLASYNGSNIVSGSQQVKVIPINSSSLGQDQGTGVTNIQNQLASAGAVVDPSGGVKICFVSGGTDQSGLITIGSNGRQLSVILSIKGNKTCT